MQVIPLKEKYSFNEEDINSLSKMIAEERTLEQISYAFGNRVTPEQVFIAVGIIVSEMYDSTIEEMCPHILKERSRMNETKRKHWSREKREANLLAGLKSISEDLALYESELTVELARVSR